MARTGRPKTDLELTLGDRDQLSRWALRRSSSQALALRSRIVLGCADGLDNKSVAEGERVTQATVGKWRRRFVRHGVTSLFAAFNTADGTVISSLHRRHRTIEFKKFLTKIDNQVPEDLDVHLVCDNYGSHKSPAIKKWLTV